MARRHVLIGSGPAAIAAAEAIRGARRRRRDRRRRRRPARLLLAARPRLLPGTRCREERLFPFTPQDFARLGPRRGLGEARRSIDPAAHSVTPARAAARLAYDRLLHRHRLQGDRRSACPAPSWTAWSSSTTWTTRATSIAPQPPGARRRSSSAAASRRSRSSRACAPAACTCTTSCARTATGATCSRESESRIVEEGLRARGVRDPPLHRARRHPRPRAAGSRRVETGERRRDPLRPRGRGDRRPPAESSWPQAAGLDCGARDPRRRAPALERRRHLRRRRRRRGARAGHRPAHARGAVELGGGQGPGRRPQHGRRARRTSTSRRAAQRHAAGRLQDHDHRHGRQRQRRRPRRALARRQPDLVASWATRRSWSAQRRRRPHPARPGRAAPSPARSSWATRRSRSRCRTSSRRTRRRRATHRGATLCDGRRTAPRRPRSSTSLTGGELEGAPCLGACRGALVRARRDRRRHGALRASPTRRRARFPAASGLVGHGIGVVGFVLMLMTETLYSIRKLLTDARWGSMAGWLQVPHGHRARRARTWCCCTRRCGSRGWPGWRCC